MSTRRLSWREVLRRRLFPAHFRLPRPWSDYYWRRVPPPALRGVPTTQACRYAF
ncbi:MAG: hypothetical protein GF330_02570 [Candidatus Eisenbacteria bacterium]|nr:hypothetical protein [Candidatus Eisenbacteria bacterium]